MKLKLFACYIDLCLIVCGIDSHCQTMFEQPHEIVHWEAYILKHNMLPNTFQTNANVDAIMIDKGKQFISRRKLLSSPRKPGFFNYKLLAPAATNIFGVALALGNDEETQWMFYFNDRLNLIGCDVYKSICKYMISTNYPNNSQPYTSLFSSNTYNAFINSHLRIKERRKEMNSTRQP